MCGRYVNVASDSDLIDEFDVEETIGEDLPRSWNIAPTDAVRIIVERNPIADRAAPPIHQLRTAQWGLLPSWSKSRSGGAKMINARSETIASRPAFKTAAGRRRALIPADGYYEWTRDGGRKIPYFLHDPDDRTLAMAGLYEIWRDDSLPETDPNRWVWTCTVITRPATDLLGDIHDRCPVIVPPDLRPRWLDCGTGDALVAANLLEVLPEPHLEPRLVSSAVGNVKNNGPELIEPAGDEQDGVRPLPLDDTIAGQTRP